MIDIHCHVLPGIDDGPRSWEQSLDLCRAMVDNGIRQAIATPHLIDGIYQNTRSRVDPLVSELRERLRLADVPLDVLSGAEVDLACHLVSSPSDELPTLGGGKAVLLEMPVAVVPHAMADIIFSIRAQDLIPVLAHPERNELVQEDLDLVREWIRAGAAIQVDGDSFLGVWGRQSKRCAEKLLVAGLTHAIASDAHSCDRRPPRLRQALEKAVDIIGPEASALVTSGPRTILAGEVPEAISGVGNGTHEKSSTRRRRRSPTSMLGRFLNRSDR